MAEPIRLYRHDQIKELQLEEFENPEPAAYACKKCGTICPDMRIAMLHCEPQYCEECSKEAPKHHSLCGRCRAVIQVKKELQAYRKAQKVEHPKDYDGPVQVPSIGDNDGFFESVTEFLEFCQDEEMPPPEVIWTCTIRHFRMDAEHLVDMQLEDFYEGAREDVSPEDIAELQGFLDGWCRKRNIHTWDPNYKRAVELRFHGGGQ